METIAQKTKMIISETLGVDLDKLTNETDFIKDLGADSLDVVEMVSILEKHFNISVPDEKVQQCKNVGHYIEYFEQARILNLTDRPQMYLA